MREKMLGTRVASAVILIPIVLLAVWYSVETMAILAAVGALIGTFEFYNMAAHAPARYRPLYLPGFVLAAFLCYLAWSPYTRSLILSAIAILLFLIFAAIFLLLRDIGLPKLTDSSASFGMNWLLTVFGPVYVALPLALLVLIRKDEPANQLSGWIWLALIGTWGTDTAAYFVGRWLGKHKLAPQISPKKTVEGAIGGIIFGVICTIIIGKLLIGLPLLFAGLVGLVISTACIVGDLLESWAKRRFDTKDSGNLIPGHGGLLDRIDSFLAVCVIVYIFFKIYPYLSR